MELHQLHYFLAIVDSGTFTAAAEAVHVSQSGVSTQVRKLERELGVELLERSSRRVRLTAEGERLVPYARAAVAAVDEVRAAALDLRGLVSGTLRVGAVTGLAWPPLFDALAGMHAEHPGIDIRLQEGMSRELIERVREGSLDLAVAAWTDAAPDDLRTSTVVDETLAVLVAPRHPWVSRSRIHPAELARVDLISLPPGTGARDALDAVMAREGARVLPRWEVATPAYIEVLAARGLGVGVLNIVNARQWTTVKAVPIASPAARSALGVIWRPAPTHAARALLDRLVG